MLNKETISTSLKLLVITAVAALCLALVNKITAPVIAQNQVLTIESTQREVLPDADSFKTIDFSNDKIEYAKSDGTYIDAFYSGMSGDTVVGYVVTAVSKQGYGGDIKVMVGINSDNTINKVKITETKETAGLGLNASKPNPGSLSRTLLIITAPSRPAFAEMWNNGASSALRTTFAPVFSSPDNAAASSATFLEA